MNNLDDKDSVDIELILDVTRQKLILATLANTELEALVQELKNKIKKLEKEKNDSN